MKYSNKILIYTSIFFLCSCTSGFPKGKKKKNEKKNWETFVNTPATDSSIKSYWVDVVDGRWNFFREQGSSITKEDVPNLKFIHSIFYTIDSTSLFTFKKGKSINSLLTLDKKHVATYAVKNDSIQAVISPAFSEGKWINDHGYGVLPHSMSKIIFNTYKSGGEVYNINLIAFPKSNSRPNTILRQYIVVNIKNRFSLITYNGILASFEDELLNIKKYALQVANTLKR